MTPLSIFLISALLLLCAVSIIALILAESGPPQDEIDTEPPSDFMPDITAATHKKLWDSIK